MPEPLLKIEIDASSLIAALNQLGDRAEKHVKAAAKVTADNIAREAKARVARLTGKTMEGILVEETNNGEGYLVIATNPEMPGLPGWIEHGTKTMAPRPFLFTSAALESGMHDRRVRQAIQDAIDETGLGD